MDGIAAAVVLGMELWPELAITITFFKRRPAACCQDGQQDRPKTHKQYPPSAQTHTVKDTDPRPEKAKRDRYDNCESRNLLDYLQCAHQPPLSLLIHHA
jgi:hypothetical protein